jgi:AcrR family transcriptional regulator
MDLFLDQGFDNTTVEQICAAAGMSRSTFFRHFPAKEDVVLGELVDYGQRVLDALKGRPVDEPVWVSLRHALEPVLPPAGHELGRSLRRSRMFIETPALRARHLEKTLTWQEILIPEVARRLGSGAHDPRPAALIGSALACMDAALIAWTGCEGATSLIELLAHAMNAVGCVDAIG